jgi:hypothetical protein
LNKLINFSKSKENEAMKMMVILAVLCAALLLVTGAAFAASFCTACGNAGGAGYCYSVDGTDLDNSTNSFTGQNWQMCFNLNNSFAWISGSPAFHFSDFYAVGLLNEQAISWDSGNVGLSVTFHGPGGNALNGIYYNGTDRFKIHGIGGYCCDE